MLDFDHLQRPEIDNLVPAFDTVCCACAFLAGQLQAGQGQGVVYPHAMVGPGSAAR